jgi:hypothetical protein
MNRPGNQSTANQTHFAYEFHGTWSENVESWTQGDRKGVYVVRYEDLQSAPETTFDGIVRFLGLPATPERLQRAIRNSAFTVLQAQERRAGFRERSRKSDVFFRSGRSGEGVRRLTPDQVAALRQAHETQMRRFGYWEPGQCALANNSAEGCR